MQKRGQRNIVTQLFPTEGASDGRDTYLVVLATMPSEAQTARTMALVRKSMGAFTGCR